MAEPDIAQRKTSLKIITWNIGGVKYNLKHLRECLGKCDIIFVQEHWLYSDSLSFLDTIDCSFTSWGRSSSELNDDSISRRGKGGISFLW